MRARAWCLTINNYTFDDIIDFYELYYDKQTVTYFVVGEEVGESGTPHLQAFVYYKNATTRDAISKHFVRAHITKSYAFDTDKKSEAWEYCKKDGNYWEEGKPPSQGKLTKEKMEEVMANPMENLHLYNQYRKSYQVAKWSVASNPDVKHLLLVSEEYVDQFLDNEKFDDVCWSFRDYTGEPILVIRGVDINFSDNLARLIIDWFKNRKTMWKHGYEKLPFHPRMVVLCDEYPYDSQWWKKHIPHYSPLNCEMLVEEFTL